ncbi:extracellular solute-binding protein [Paenibacillus methanolicus]|uniref:Putative aldouronate transport system substrate-binding protein n=1 Tax=Paenibacillus methanolicus TaxID=582686 RepID=A0A5S5C5U7_9BACL|nr:extracellular solute-binding protein [Paenibacillus methanolicus]TYP73968.1 putative aldouronate transport system substrate-binding protein [Paenibacillus methanolicus]
MSMKQKRASLFVVLTMLTSLLAACGGNNNNGGNAPAPANDGAASNNGAAVNGEAAADGEKKLEKVELTWYLLGDAHKDQDKVVAEFNKMLSKDLNATIKLNFTTWNDWQTKYNLLLTSGEKVDMIFASSWSDYYKLAKQGAFLDLKDLLPQYAPTTWGNVPKQDWESVTVAGGIYAVPNTNAEYTPDGFVYREDWRKELNLPEFTDVNSIEAYLDAVKTQKKVTPINGAAYENVQRLFRTWYDFQPIGSDVIGATSYDAPRDIQVIPFTAQFEEWVKRMKTWADKGYWNKNALSSKQEAGDFIKTGQGAYYWRNPSSAGGFINEITAKQLKMEIGYFPFTRFHNYVIPTLPIANGMAIPKSSKNPERSLMVLDKLRNDSAYFNLLTYGIEGTHWAKGEDDKTIVIPAPGVDLNKTPRYDIASWGWRYEPNMKGEKGGWAGLDKLKEEFKPISKPDIFGPIYMDYEPVKAELAAVNQVFEQYGKPLMLGLTSNVDASLMTYRDKLKAAGIEKVLEYVKTEANKYYDEKGIQ